jgi:hypothetical protein
MSTIAELLVKIGGDNAGLKKILADSQSGIEKTFSANPINEFTGALGGATNGISGMIGKISGLAALAAGGFGLGTLVEGAVNAGESVYQLSTRMGITSAEASNLNRILKLTGGDSDSFGTAMMRLDKNFSDTGETGDKTRAVLSAFGISLTDSNGKLLPLNQQLAEMSKGYKLAAANGLQQEFVMQTLGTRGLSLVKTLKDYDEAAENASKIKGIGLDPKQMHDLKQELDVVSLQAGQMGLAFTGALAPVAQELFPPIMSGLQRTASFLADNKTGVMELTKDALELVVAYKSMQLLASTGNSVNTFWQNAAAQAAASTAKQEVAATELSVVQERTITRSVAASDKMYAKMQADAVKTAQTAGLSAEETATIITEKCIQIATKAAEAAAAIRTQMTEAFLQSNIAAAESAVVINKALASTGVAAAEAAAVKTNAITESAALCSAAVMESSAAQIAAIAEIGAASVLAGKQSVAANEMGAASARLAATAQTELTVATTLAGNEAVIAGEKTVGAMATAEVAVKGLIGTVYTLMGGWAGVATAVGYAIYKLYDYYDTKNQVESYNKDAQVYKDPKTGEMTKKAFIGATTSYTNRGEITTPGHWGRVALSDAELEEQQAFEYKKAHALDQPQIDGATVTMPDLSGNKGKNEARQVVKAEADYEVDIEKNKAKLLLDTVKSEETDLDSERKNGLNGIRQYWASREDEDTAGLSTIKTYWDKRTALDSEGINAELDALNAEKAALETEITATSDPSDSINLKKQLLDITTNITLKERELGEVVKKNTDLANAESVEFIDKYASLLKSTKESMKDVNATNVSGGLYGSAKDLSDMNNDKISQLKAVQDVVDTWDKAAAEIKDKYGIALEDTVNKDKWKAQQTEMINKQSIDKVNEYYATGKAVQADLDEARNRGNINDYMSELNSQDGLLKRSLDSRQALIDEQADLWKIANHTVYDDAATLMADTYSGLESVLEKFAHGTESAGDLFKDFAQSVIDSMIKIQEQALAANVTQGLMGLFGGTVTNNGLSGGSGGNGANTKAAITSSFFSTAFSFASGGQIFGEGTGTSDSILARVSNGEYVIQDSAVRLFGPEFFDTLNAGKLPAFSTGGIVTGAPLSSMSGSYSNANITKSGSGSTSKPGIIFNITNNTDSEVSAQNTSMSVDGDDYICDIVLNKLDRSPAYAKNVNMALGR